MLNGAAGALKTDWAKPFHDARPMGIEWLAELWTKGNWSVEDDGLAVVMR
jgi:hypothetical protein